MSLGLTKLWLLILLAACLGLTAAAGAENLPAPVIRDDADLLTPAEEEALLQDMLPISFLNHISQVPFAM